VQLFYNNAQDFKMTVTKRKHGICKIFILPVTFFNSADYQRIAHYAQETTGMFTAESVIQMGERFNKQS
jgi:DNA gyrase subunit B